MNHKGTNQTMCKTVNNELKSIDCIAIIKESMKDLDEQEHQLSLKRSSNRSVCSDISELSSDTVDYHYRPIDAPPSSICVNQLFESVYIDKEDSSQKQNAIFSSPLDDYLRTQKKYRRDGRLNRAFSVKSLAAKASKRNFYKWASSSSSANHVDKLQSRHQRSSSQQIAKRLGLIRR
jgi:hypothetical protein